MITNKWRWHIDSEGTWVSFCVEDARGLLSGLVDGKAYDLTVKEFRKKRSLNANAYFWTLVNALAGVLGVSPMEIYRSYVPDVGGNYITASVRTDLVQEFKREWCEGHDGRLVVNMGESFTNPGYTDLRCYKGSSDFSGAQMARLIDMVVEDCKAQGIDVISDKERQAMLEAWAEGYEKHYSK